MVLSPISWLPTRYVLCDDEIKYSDSGRVMSCQTLEWWSENGELSAAKRNDVKVSNVQKRVGSVDSASATISSVGEVTVSCPVIEL